jgi:AraC family transcriptional regulator of adaptative response/methylated-DNA-[protein]-cysteine methyltransferase
VRRAIGFISTLARQPTIEAMAAAAAVTPDELHHLFRRWAGLTPKAFMQALTLDHAKASTRSERARRRLDSGLSGPGGCTICSSPMTMSPGEWNGGAGMTLPLVSPSPFGPQS